MKTTRVGGGHPDYLVRADPDPNQPDAARPTFQQDLWHYTLARMVDACATFGLLPFYGPFGDIKDTVACEDQFRNAYLLGCVGAWSLHPVQIEIAKRVFSPQAAEVAHAQRVIDAMGDGTGAIMLDGKMEDDASVKQCKVVVELAHQLAARDPRTRGGLRIRVVSDLRPRRSVLYMPAANEPRSGEGEDTAGRLDHLRPRRRSGARRQGISARGGMRGCCVGRLRPARVDDPLQRPRHFLGSCRPGRDRIVDGRRRRRPEGQFCRLSRRHLEPTRHRRRTGAS